MVYPSEIKSAGGAVLGVESKPGGTSGVFTYTEIRFQCLHFNALKIMIVLEKKQLYLNQ